jgi:hypothetical protein
MAFSNNFVVLIHPNPINALSTIYNHTHEAPVYIHPVCLSPAIAGGTSKSRRL